MTEVTDTPAGTETETTKQDPSGLSDVIRESISLGGSSKSITIVRGGRKPRGKGSKEKGELPTALVEFRVDNLNDFNNLCAAVGTEQVLKTFNRLVVREASLEASSEAFEDTTDPETGETVPGFNAVKYVKELNDFFQDPSRQKGPKKADLIVKLQALTNELLELISKPEAERTVSDKARFRTLALEVGKTNQAIQKKTRTGKTSK